MPAPTREGPTARRLFAAAACTAALVAGCGSGGNSHQSSRHTITPTTAAAAGQAMAAVGAAGTIGPAKHGPYKATKQGVLFNMKVALVRLFTSKGYSGVTVYCKGLSAGSASCSIAGMNRSNQSAGNTITVSLDRTSGKLQITHVAS